MKILLINYEYPPYGGGGGIFSHDLVSEWKKAGHQVDVLTSNFLRTKKKKTPLINLALFPIVGILKGLFFCLKNKYDIINTHFAIPTGPVGFVLSKLFRIKNILSIHGGDIYDPTKQTQDNSFLKPAIKFILNHADAVVAQSNNIKDLAEKYYQPKKKIEVIPLGIKESIVRNAHVRSQQNQSFRFISIGRLVPRKGFDYLIKALPDKAELVLIGSGPEKNKLEELAKTEKKKITFLGETSQEKKEGELSKADAYVLSSLHEGFALVCLEAMAAGLAIVATNFGGQTDYLKENKNVLLVKPKDVDSMRWALIKIMADNELRIKLSENNLRDVQKYYIKNSADKYLTLFKNVA
jgi:glycosyltransferase involved in cell wall biosynthesis